MAKINTEEVLCKNCILSKLNTEFTIPFFSLVLVSSPGLLAATAASYCPSRPGELPKLIATEYRTQGAEPPCTYQVVGSMMSGQGVMS